MCEYTRVHEQKAPPVQLSHDGSTSRCCKLQVMSSHLLPCLHHHMVQALKSRVLTDFLGAAVGCPQVYRDTFKLELFSMSMTLSSLEPSTNLAILHYLSSTISSMKMWNSMEHSTDLKVQCLFTLF